MITQQSPVVAVAYKSATAPFTPKYSVQPSAATAAKPSSVSDAIKHRVIPFIEQLKLGDVTYKKLSSTPDWAKLLR